MVPIAAARWPRLKAIVYVVDGVVARIRGVEADLAKWDTDDRGYADVPVAKPLTELQIAKRLPTLGIALGDHRPHVAARSANTCLCSRRHGRRSWSCQSVRQAFMKARTHRRIPAVRPD
ncbi:hypothetical protein AB0383_22860 [Amycolatopsis sp. NPDC051373]|uniref:hypothetical protein n=1 Tax=Amycolatopsis sp. NPDC051373 TaxID=3155801 RepID=UPI00344FD751